MCGTWPGRYDEQKGRVEQEREGVEQVDGLEGAGVTDLDYRRRRERPEAEAGVHCRVPDREPRRALVSMEQLGQEGVLARPDDACAEADECCRCECLPRGLRAGRG